MNTPIPVPLWIFIVMLALSIWAVIEKIFFPLLRNFLKQRVYKTLAIINPQLKIAIRPFQLTKKSVLVDRLAYDPLITKAIEDQEADQELNKEQKQKKVEEYAREIVPAFNAYIYHRYSYWFAKTISQKFYRIRGGFVDEKRLSKVDPEATVVFVINHRSNMDYILVSYLTSGQVTLSYAVGEWANFWPLKNIIQGLGAFFVRRASGNQLYRLVLQRYVNMASRAGVCQAVFPEGKLSRDGCLLAPKLGFLDYILRGYNWEKDRDIVFVPVGINYDRVLEDRNLLDSLSPEPQRKTTRFFLATTLKFIRRLWQLKPNKRWLLFGYAGVNFGNPISTKEFCQQENICFSKLERQSRFVQVEKLAKNLMHNISHAIPILPVPLITSVLLKNMPKALSSFEVKAEVYQYISYLQKQGAPIKDNEKPSENNIINALSMLKMRGLLLETDGKYQVVAEFEKVLAYYANSIAHFEN